MFAAKRFFKRNTHNAVFKALAGFGRAINRHYENRNHDISTNGELTVLKKLARFNPRIIIDAGANIGKYALLAREQLPDCKIFAFEPVRCTFLELQENTKNFEEIIAINKGFYSKKCEQAINLYESNTHSSLYDLEGVAYSPLQTETISLITGDSFLKENNIEKVNFLKIDVEGAEFEALNGFENYLAEGKIEAIQFEYGYINISTRKLLIDFHNYLEKFGYQLGKIYPKTVEFRAYTFKHEDFLGPNFIAVHNSAANLLEYLKKK